MSYLVTLGVPVAIGAVAFSYLQERYDDFVHYFFEQLTAGEKISLLALLFAAVYMAIGIAKINFGTIPASRKKNIRYKGSQKNDGRQVIQYPLDEMNQVLSDRQKFSCIYPWLRDAILDEMRQENEMNEEVVEWLRRMMDYNVPGGKLNRGTTVVAVFRKIQNRPLRPTEIADACILGWTIEFLQAFFLITDDVIGNCQTRREKPCWHKLPDVRMKAVNDAFLLESFVLTIVRRFFHNLPCYTAILELLLDVIQKTELGQLLDLKTSEPDNGKMDISKFTLERYQSIVRYKTAYYSFYLPVALAMRLAGIADETAYMTTKKICCIMGEYFQVQDDVINCFGDPKHHMQTGTDIQDQKCSWLVCQALRRGSVAQREVIENNYGDDDEAKVGKIKQVYQDLKLEEAFRTYQEESYEQIQMLLEHVKAMPKDVFQILLTKIYKRTVYDIEK